MASDSNNNDTPHGKIEKNIFILLCCIVVVAAVGGMIEILPLFKKEVSIEVVGGMLSIKSLKVSIRFPVKDVMKKFQNVFLRKR